jgi:hypothetical protein
MHKDDLVLDFPEQIENNVTENIKKVQDEFRKWYEFEIDKKLPDAIKASKINRLGKSVSVFFLTMTPGLLFSTSNLAINGFDFQTIFSSSMLMLGNFMTSASVMLAHISASQIKHLLSNKKTNAISQDDFNKIDFNSNTDIYSTPSGIKDIWVVRDFRKETLEKQISVLTTKELKNYEKKLKKEDIDYLKITFNQKQDCFQVSHFNSGKLHNTNGPSIYKIKDGEINDPIFFLKGQKVSEIEFIKKIKEKSLLYSDKAHPYM